MQHTPKYLAKKASDRVSKSVNYRWCQRCGNCEFKDWHHLSNILKCKKHPEIGGGEYGQGVEQMGVCDDYLRER